MKKFVITALAALAVGTTLSSTAQAETQANVWVNGSAASYDTYVVGVGAEGRVGRVKLDLYVSPGQIITGVRNGTALCQFGSFGATCDLGSGSFPQFFEVTVKRQESARGPFHLEATATTSAVERNYADNTAVIETY
ncbi:hypothetical protein [Nonomuraea dietziae]|uniref:hypothetical protein n=1 Tax=Nonomuraea dietziae TaxID=65515 RepID=UPI0033DF21A5